jgi:hypothetical protein
VVRILNSTGSPGVKAIRTEQSLHNLKEKVFRKISRSN